MDHAQQLAIQEDLRKKVRELQASFDDQWSTPGRRIWRTDAESREKVVRGLKLVAEAQADIDRLAPPEPAATEIQQLLATMRERFAAASEEFARLDGARSAEVA
jgi:hypothetical protein